MKIKLTRQQFWQLHKRVFEKCFGHDFNTEFKNNPSVTKIYGFSGGKNHLRSVRNIIDPKGQINGFNTRLLHTLRKNYDEGKGVEVLEITEYLLLDLLKYIKLKNIDDLESTDPAPDRIKSLTSEVIPAYTNAYNARFLAFENSIWYLYNEDKDIEQKDKIFRSILKVGNSDESGNLNVDLFTSGDKQYSNFSGKIIKRYSNLNIIHIILNAAITSHNPTKFRYIILRIEETGKVEARSKEMYIGQYLRYDSNNVINACIVIAQRQETEDERLLQPDVFSNRQLGIEQTIEEYFQLTPSKLVTPSNIFSPNDLRREVNKIKSAQRVAVEQTYDLYIATIVTALLNKRQQLKQLYEDIEVMKKDPLLKTIGIKNIYSRTKDQLLERTASDKQLIRELKKIRESKYCLFIYPVAKKITSSIDVLLGAALYSGKPVFILHKGIDFLPRILQKEIKTLKLIGKKESITSFPEWLRDNLPE